MTGLSLVLLLLQSILGTYGALYITTAITAPGWFLDNLAVNHIRRRRLRQDDLSGDPWWTMPVTIVTILSVGVIVYAAAHAIVAVMPFDWGTHDEDGEWSSLRYYIQAMVGFFGALGLTGQLEKNAEVLVWGPHERRARGAVTKAIRYASSLGADERDRIAATTERDLEIDPLELRGYARETAIDIQRIVGRDLRQ